MTFLIDLFLYVLSIYFICGIAFGFYFMIFGASKIDPILAETKKRVRFLLIPGLIATWPVFMYRLFRKDASTNATLGLKKLHLIIWFVVILIIPPIIYTSANQLDFTRTNALNEVGMANSKEGGASIENDLIAISKNNNTLSLRLKSPLKSASSLVYSCDVQGKKLILLGQVDSDKMYRFNLQKDIQGVLIYDGIKNKTITKLLFP